MSQLINLDLLHAAQIGDVQRVRSLLATGASVNAKKEDGNSVLHLGCMTPKNRSTLIDTLLSAFAINTNAKNRRLETPLHILSRHGDGANIGKLISSGASPFSADETGDYPSHVALKSGNLEAFNSILENAYPKAKILELRDSEGNSALHLLAQDFPCSIYGVITKGFDVRYRNKNGDFPDDLCQDKALKKVLRTYRISIDADSDLVPAISLLRAEEAKEFLRDHVPTRIIEPP